MITHRNMKMEEKKKGGKSPWEVTLLDRQIWCYPSEWEKMSHQYLLVGLRSPPALKRKQCYVFKASFFPPQVKESPDSRELACWKKAVQRQALYMVREVGATEGATSTSSGLNAVPYPHPSTTKNLHCQDMGMEFLLYMLLTIQSMYKSAQKVYVTTFLPLEPKLSLSAIMLTTYTCCTWKEHFFVVCWYWPHSGGRK